MTQSSTDHSAGQSPDHSPDHSSANSSANSSKKKAGATSSPRYMAVAEKLRRQILTGKLPAGMRIHTEPMLAQEFDVSVGTIRKAQDLLITQGLLNKRQGSGTYVAGDAKSSPDVLWVCGVDIFNHDLSPYYAHYLQYCRSFAAEANLNIKPVLLSNDDPKASLAYCSPVSSRNYLGYMFVGCEFPKHRLLRYAVDQQLCFTHVDRGEPAPGKIIIPYGEAFEQGVTHLLDQGHDKVDVIVLDPKTVVKLVSRNGEFIRQMGQRVRIFEVPAADRMSEVETNGYQAMCHHLLEQTPASGMLIMDDILARGVTRAMLQHPDKLPENMELVVVAGLQEHVPLGVDATWLLHDVEEEARQAVAIISNKIKHPENTSGCFVSHFTLKTVDQLDHALGRSGRTDASMIQHLMSASGK